MQERGKFQIRGWQLDGLTMGNRREVKSDTCALSKGYCLFKFALQVTLCAHTDTTHTPILSLEETGAVQWKESLMSPIHNQNNK